MRITKDLKVQWWAKGAKYVVYPIVLVVKPARDTTDEHGNVFVSITSTQAETLGLELLRRAADARREVDDTVVQMECDGLDSADFLRDHELAASS